MPSRPLIVLQGQRPGRRRRSPRLQRRARQQRSIAWRHTPSLLPSGLQRQLH